MCFALFSSIVTTTKNFAIAVDSSDASRSHGGSNPPISTTFIFVIQFIYPINNHMTNKNFLKAQGPVAEKLVDKPITKLFIDSINAVRGKLKMNELATIIVGSASHGEIEDPEAVLVVWKNKEKEFGLEEYADVYASLSTCKNPE